MSNGKVAPFVMKLCKLKSCFLPICTPWRLRMTVEFAVMGVGHLNKKRVSKLEMRSTHSLSMCSLSRDSFPCSRWLITPHSGSLIHPLGLHVTLGLRKVYFEEWVFFSIWKKPNTAGDFPSHIGYSVLESAIDILCQGIFSKLVCVSYPFHSVHHVTSSSQKKTTPVLMLHKVDWLIRILWLWRVGMLQIQKGIILGYL